LVKGALQSRFIAAALGTPYTQNTVRLTGRHWWGRSQDNLVDPVLNRESEELAAILGLPGFQPNERGTTILIIQPSLAGKTFRDAMHLMAEYLLWYFWPKMIPIDGDIPNIQFELSLHGKALRLPSPEEFPPLEGFVQAMKRLKSTDASSLGNSGEIHSIQSKQYRQHLGKLSLELFPAKPRIQRASSQTAPIQTPSHHVALMRQPELVVRYLEGPELPSSQIEYAGVFITDTEVDAVFADSEPPTHDDWVSDVLSERREKAYINVALREIKDKLKDFVRPSAMESLTGEVIPLGAFSNHLGALLPGQTGTAAFSNLFNRRRSVKHNPLNNFASGRGIDLSNSVKPATPQRPELFIDEGSRAVPKTAVDDPIPHVPTQYLPPQSYLPPAIQSQSATPPKENRPLPNNPIDTSYSKSVYDRSPEPLNVAKPSNQFPNPSIVLPQKPKPSKARMVRLEKGEIVVLEDESLALQVEFEFSFSGDPCDISVVASVGALLDGGEIEAEPPEDSAIPEVLYWVGPGGARYERASEIIIPSSQAGIWYIVVSFPENVMVGVDLDLSVPKNMDNTR
jgi:hypothetical protein